MAGVTEIVLGAAGVVMAGILRLRRVIRWMEDDIDARYPQTPLRRFRILDGVLDAHYRISRKWGAKIMAPFFLLVGVGMIATGLAEII